MIVELGESQHLGKATGSPVLAFVEAPKQPGAWAGLRQLTIDGAPQFELSYWCGTCRLLFERRESTAQPIIDESTFGARLAEGLARIDQRVVAQFASLLPMSDYQPILLEITPSMTEPSTDDDYFSKEQLQTYWPPAHDPKTLYYRTYQAPISERAHLYEFAIPMIPPGWNDASRVQQYMDLIAAGSRPTAVAVSILDISAPANEEGPDYYEHWALTHYILDGHHKMEAASRLGLPITLLSLVATTDGLASAQQVETALAVRSPGVSRLR